MNLSYNWLKDYLKSELNPEQLAAALTSIGLETGSIEKVEAIPGSLAGIVVGKILTCIKHPDADKLHITTVNIGAPEPVQIVCGAPNVAAGQTVLVAAVGTKLPAAKEPFTIKKTKIRGVESCGMICAEDELGLGNDHSGIVVLPPELTAGTPAAHHYNIEHDFRLEVDITPNRIDAASHLGVAIDLAAYLSAASGQIVKPVKPCVNAFKPDSDEPVVTVEINSPKECIRYSGLTIRNVAVGESPQWLKQRLETIGLRPLNNIVDITNFVMHESGMPMHAFDLNEVTGNKIIVKTLPEGTKFTTLDGKERTLSATDLMICNQQTGMCLAGILGGLKSGVKETTTDIFLEAACFNPTMIRKTARRHNISTDASFRFERGADPENTIYALKRAALMVKALAGGKITGNIQDAYPIPVEKAQVALAKKKIWDLAGKKLPVEIIESILGGLEINIRTKTDTGWLLEIPTYRVDVTREVDVIEDVLRIYGYNNIESGTQLKTNLPASTNEDISYRMQNIISEQLTACGFNEIMNNSLSTENYYKQQTEILKQENCVRIRNPQSAELNVMRQTLLFGGLESIIFNRNHKNPDLHLYEFGNVYLFDPGRQTEENSFSAIREEFRLALWLTGDAVSDSWLVAQRKTSVYELRAIVENILLRLGMGRRKLNYVPFSDEIFASAFHIETPNGKRLGDLGILAEPILKMFDIPTEVYFSELNWNALMKEHAGHSIRQREIPRFPAVRRDLALLLDKNVPFAKIEETAFHTDRKILKEVILFDVYEGGNLPEGKKSYAVSFTLQDEEKTLDDNRIETLMTKIRENLEHQLGAVLRVATR
jgi:phenylalanyl-tRNA synthetase beta chain